jgi:starch phosphorylase
MRVEDVQALQKRGYKASDYIAKNPELSHCIEQIETGFFTPGKCISYKKAILIQLHIFRSARRSP